MARHVITLRIIDKDGLALKMKGYRLYVQTPVPEDTDDEHDHDGEGGYAIEETAVGGADVTTTTHGEGN